MGRKARPLASAAAADFRGGWSGPSAVYGLIYNGFPASGPSHTPHGPAAVLGPSWAVQGTKKERRPRRRPRLKLSEN